MSPTFNDSRWAVKCQTVNWQNKNNNNVYVYVFFFFDTIVFGSQWHHSDWWQSPLKTKRKSYVNIMPISLSENIKYFITFTPKLKYVYDHTKHNLYKVVISSFGWL